MTSGELLKRIRKEQNLSLRAVSLLSGVSHTQISDLENNVNFGTIEKIEKILNSLHVSESLREQYYTLRDLERTPESVKEELTKLRKEIKDLKNSCIIKNNSNTGDILVGSTKKIYTSIDEDLKGLSEDEIQLVKNYIAFLKAQKLSKI